MTTRYQQLQCLVTLGRDCTDDKKIFAKVVTDESTDGSTVDCQSQEKMSGDRTRVLRRTAAR